MNLTTSSNSYVTSRDGMYVLVQNEYDPHTHCFLNKIFDFKTGYIKASFKQLDIYAALFCLEYRISPEDITIEQRIYQSNEITYYSPC